MKLKLIIGICLVPLCIHAQTSASSGPPIYVLYRLFFRDIAAVDAAAAKSDAAGLPGGDGARASYQNSLRLTAGQAATLKQSARQCNQALDQHQQKAQPSIAAVQTRIGSSPGPFTPPPQLVALEQERTAISNTCIENLHTALGDRKFMDIDVFVRTRFAPKVSAIPPANAPFANVPVAPMSPGAGK